MWQDFEGGAYWDELAEICGDISRAAGFQGAARFRGNTVLLLDLWAPGDINNGKNDFSV